MKLEKVDPQAEDTRDKDGLENAPVVKEDGPLDVKGFNVGYGNNTDKVFVNKNHEYYDSYNGMKELFDKEMRLSKEKFDADMVEHEAIFQEAEFMLEKQLQKDLGDLNHSHFLNRNNRPSDANKLDYEDAETLERAFRDVNLQGYQNVRDDLNAESENRNQVNLKFNEWLDQESANNPAESQNYEKVLEIENKRVEYEYVEKANAKAKENGTEQADPSTPPAPVNDLHTVKKSERAKVFTGEEIGINETLAENYNASIQENQVVYSDKVTKQATIMDRGTGIRVNLKDSTRFEKEQIVDDAVKLAGEKYDGVININPKAPKAVQIMAAKSAAKNGFDLHSPNQYLHKVHADETEYQSIKAEAKERYPDINSIAGMFEVRKERETAAAALENSKEAPTPEEKEKTATRKDYVLQRATLDEVKVEQEESPEHYQNHFKSRLKERVEERELEKTKKLNEKELSQ